MVFNLNYAIGVLLHNSGSISLYDSYNTNIMPKKTDLPEKLFPFRTALDLSLLIPDYAILEK